jgi:hypothetical protein
LKEDLMILKKRRSSRKSRRVRLPSASYTGTTRFTPSAEEWQRTENPLGLRFSEENRQELATLSMPILNLCRSKQQHRSRMMLKHT